MSLFSRTPKGSVLVFSLIVLAIMLSAALTVAMSSLINRRSVGNSVQSNQSFQVANSGVELASQKIYKHDNNTLDALAQDMGGSCNQQTNTIIKSDLAGGTATLTFFDQGGNIIPCNSVNWRSEVVKMKSEGNAFGTTRVIETAVAAGGLNTQIVTCPSWEMTAPNQYRCRIDCPNGWKVSGGGYGYGTVYTNGINAFPKSSTQWECDFAKDTSQGNQGCSSGTGDCGASCYAVCIQ